MRAASLSQPTPAGAATRLFLLGFLTLFLELAMIRYLAGSIWNLGYFPNLVLIAVFVGMGLGFACHRRFGAAASSAIYEGAAPLMLLTVAVVALLRPSVPGFGEWSGEFGGELYFTSVATQSGPASWALFAVWFFMVAGIFALVAQRTAKLFQVFPPLKAYTLDISGSCAGILAFMAMSWLRAPPWVWFACAGALFCAASGRFRPAIGLLWAATAALTALQDAVPPSGFEGYRRVLWSPYQKVEYLDRRGVQPHILANGLPHQHLAPGGELDGFSRGVPYSRPYLERGGRPCRRVLILGSGAGNDVAAALRRGAERVDAVEIDPVVAEFGRRHHPEHPYADPRVKLTVDDGRAFLTRSRERYDLIIFALTDSLVKASPLAQLRLENYLFTEESVRRAYSLLDEGGDIVFYNFYRTPWMVAKIERLLWLATGRAPRRLYETHGQERFVMLAAGRHGERAPAPSGGGAIPTDDWPFLYVKERGLPPLYAGFMGAFAVLLALLLWFLGRAVLDAAGRRACGLSTRLAFAFMGAAFLLLETKSVIQFSLLFGTTWVNNSLVFLAALLLVLAANWAAARQRRVALAPIYVALLASCLLPFVFPLAGLLEIDSAPARFALGGALTMAPIFFANWLFSVAFRDQALPDHVFGWNLLGAMVGGVAEYASLALGFRQLTWLVVAFYTAAVACLAAGRRGVVQPFKRP